MLGFQTNRSRRYSGFNLTFVFINAKTRKYHRHACRTKKLFPKTTELPESTKLIVLSIDRLGAGYLGPYGNTWIDTAAFNRFASRSIVFENCIADRVETDSFLKAILHGVHSAYQSFNDSCPQDRLAIALTNHSSVFITDDNELYESNAADVFEEALFVEHEKRTTLCTDVAETELGTLFAAAISQLESDFDLIWIHSSGMSGNWDAPQDFREQFVSEESDEAETSDVVVPPSFVLDANFDPDALTGLMFAYAGQVALLDACVDAFLDEAEATCPNATIIIAGTRGYPLGEHKVVGDAANSLHGELIHLPLMACFPQTTSLAMDRSRRMTQPHELSSFLQRTLSETTDWSEFQESVVETFFGEPKESTAFSISGDGESSLRTWAWFLRSASESFLYSKPDDRWESNPVQDLCQPVVSELLEHLQQLTAKNGHQYEVKLSDELKQSIL